MLFETLKLKFWISNQINSLIINNETVRILRNLISVNFSDIYLVKTLKTK